MGLLFGGPSKNTRRSLEDAKKDQRIEMAREMYMNGRIKLVTTEIVYGKEIQWTFGLIVSRSYNFEKAFYGLVAQAMDANADAVVGYREHVSFHPEGDRYYSCYGTAVRFKTKK